MMVGRVTYAKLTKIGLKFSHHESKNFFFCPTNFCFILKKLMGAGIQEFYVRICFMFVIYTAISYIYRSLGITKYIFLVRELILSLLASVLAMLRVCTFFIILVLMQMLNWAYYFVCTKLCLCVCVCVYVCACVCARARVCVKAKNVL